MNYEQELRSVKDKYESARMFYYNEKGKLDQLLEQKSDMESKLLSLREHTDILEKVRILLQKVSEFARDKSRERIEGLVTNCLQYIFDSDMEFRIEINEVRGRPEAEFYVVSSAGGETVRTKPQEAKGGGVIDIISLAIRVAMLQSSSPEINGPLILDEPAKHLSEEYISRLSDFLKRVSVIFDRQVIMITHNRYLSEIADKWYKIESEDGISVPVIDS